MKENLDFLFSESESIPLGEFVVARLKPLTDVTKIIPSEQIEHVFWGCNNRASLLMGWGIAMQVSKESGNVLIVFNPKQEVTFPDNVYG